MGRLKKFMETLTKLINEKLEKININLIQKFDDRYSIEIIDKNNKHIDTLFTSINEEDAFCIIASILKILFYEKEGGGLGK
ncbi:MAG: hypothetical protein QXX41_08935 [Nitrososphaerota archaeon]